MNSKRLFVSFFVVLSLLVAPLLEVTLLFQQLPWLHLPAIAVLLPPGRILYHCASVRLQPVQP